MAREGCYASWKLGPVYLPELQNLKNDPATAMKILLSISWKSEAFFMALYV